MFRKFVYHNMIQWPQKVATKADRIFLIFSLFWLPVCVCVLHVCEFLCVSRWLLFTVGHFGLFFCSQQFAFHPVRICEHCHSDIFQPVGRTHMHAHTNINHLLSLVVSSAPSPPSPCIVACMACSTPILNPHETGIRMHTYLRAPLCYNNDYCSVAIVPWSCCLQHANNNNNKKRNRQMRAYRRMCWMKKKRYGLAVLLCGAPHRLANIYIYNREWFGTQCMLLYVLVTDAYMQRFSLLAAFFSIHQTNEMYRKECISWHIIHHLVGSRAFVVVVIVEKSSVQQPLNMQQTKFNQTARWWIKRIVPNNVAYALKI